MRCSRRDFLTIAPEITQHLAIALAHGEQLPYRGYGRNAAGYTFRFKSFAAVVLSMPAFSSSLRKLQPTMWSTGWSCH